MFERFTDRARRVVVLAQEEARLLNHNYIGTEHLLLALLQEGEGVAAQALESPEINAPAVRQKVVERGQGAATSPTGHIPFTPRAKKALELSLREALQLGHNFIGTEHLLLGLIREGGGVGCQVLVALGVDLSELRGRVIERIGAAEAEQLETEEGTIPAEHGRELLVESLMGEVRRLRREVDNLRETLRRIEPPRPAPRVAKPSAEPPSGSESLENLLHCSFCNERHDRVAKLVAGPGVYICDRCIALCQEIVDEELPSD